MTEQAEAPPEPDWGGGELPSWDMQMDPGPAESWGAGPTPPVFPSASAPVSRENHLITISITPGKPPMVVVRGDTAGEINQLLGSLERDGVYMQMAAAEQALKNSAPPAETIVRQLGATPIAQQVAQAYPTPANGFAGPPQPSPGPAPFGPTVPQFQPPVPQGGWQGGGNGVPVAAPTGWLRVSAPFQQRAAFDQVKETLHQQGLRQGNVKWDAATKTWLISPNVAGYFAQWNPVPA